MNTENHTPLNQVVYKYTRCTYCKHLPAASVTTCVTDYNHPVLCCNFPPNFRQAYFYRFTRVYKLQPFPQLPSQKNTRSFQGWAAVHGVTKSRTQLSDFPFTFHFHALEKKMATHSSVLAWRIPGTGGLVGIYPVPLPSGYSSVYSSCLYC